MRNNIKDYKWKEIYKFLRKEKGLHTSKEEKVRIFIEAIWYINRTGCQWRLLGKEYGNWRSIHRRFKRWADTGIWKRMMDFVQDPDLEMIMIDSTIIRAHACSAGYGSQKEQSLGRSVGGFTTKIHVVIDCLGNPLRFILTPGQHHDITEAKNLIKGFSGTFVIADKGYDSDTFISCIKDQKCLPVIPCRSDRKIQRQHDHHIYKDRNLIERFFGKIKHFRRIFSRFDKTARAFLAHLHFVSVLLWLA